MSSNTVLKMTATTKIKRLSFDALSNFPVDLTIDHEILLPLDVISRYNLYDMIRVAPSMVDYRAVDVPLYVDTTQPLKDGSKVNLICDGMIIELMVRKLSQGKLGHLKHQYLLYEITN